VIAQAASFLVLNSALPRMSIKTGKMLVSITACTIDQHYEIINKHPKTNQQRTK
jgi:hypothetical protein